MSINSSIPDVENLTKDSDSTEEDIEIDNTSKPDLNKKGKLAFGELEYKTFTEEFDEIIKAEELESGEELARLRKNLDQQLLQLKILSLNWQINCRENYWPNKKIMEF